MYMYTVLQYAQNDSSYPTSKTLVPILEGGNRAPPSEPPHNGLARACSSCTHGKENWDLNFRRIALRNPTARTVAQYAC